MILSILKQGFAFIEYYELIIPGLRLGISLGCSVEEKENPQLVDIDIKILFSKEPAGCHSDQLTDVTCYQTITEEVVRSLKDRSFNLIECLAAHIFEAVARHVNKENTIIEIAVTKLHHPVTHVQKGIVFKYCRRLPQTSL